MHYIDIIFLNTDRNPASAFGAVLHKLHGFLRANPSLRIGWTTPQFSENKPNPTEGLLTHISRARTGSVFRLFANDANTLLSASSAINLHDLSARRIAHITPPQPAPATTQFVANVRVRYEFLKYSAHTRNRSAAQKNNFAKARASYLADAHASAFIPISHAPAQFLLDFKPLFASTPSATDSLSSYGLSTPLNPCFLPHF